MANTRSRTAFYLGQLHPKYKRTLESLKALGEKSAIKGYLTALNDADIITDVEFRLLFIYFTSFNTNREEV